jgi:hypothetical protein
MNDYSIPSDCHKYASFCQLTFFCEPNYTDMTLSEGKRQYSFQTKFDHAGHSDSVKPCATGLHNSAS